MIIMCKHTYIYTLFMYVFLGSIHTTDKDLEFNSKKKDNKTNVEINGDGKQPSNVDSQRDSQGVGTGGLRKVSDGANAIGDTVEASHEESSVGGSEGGNGTVIIDKGTVIIDDEGTVTVEANGSSSTDPPPPSTEVEVTGTGAEGPTSGSPTLKEEGISEQTNITAGNADSSVAPNPHTDDISTTIKNNDETSLPIDSDPNSSDNQGITSDSTVGSIQGGNRSEGRDVLSTMGVFFSIKSR
jgi:hypothetical protein